MKLNFFHCILHSRPFEEPQVFLTIASSANMYFDAELYNAMDKPWESIEVFLSKTLPELGFTSKNPEIVMDVGSGPGYLSRNYVLPCFPNLKEMIAMDAAPNMIEEAEIRHSHPKIRYVVADIENKSTLKPWAGKITKLVAIHSFNWLKCQERGFRNVYDLLKPGGEAAFLFVLNSPYYDGMIETGRNARFRSYFENADYCIPESYHHNYDSTFYQKMLKDIGFQVIHCKDDIKEDILSSDEEFRDIFYSVCPLVKHLPHHLKDNFKEDLFQNILKCNGRAEDGRPIHSCKTVEILIRRDLQSDQTF